MTPITGFLSIHNPMEIAIRGSVWTKFIVPSTGSMIHVGASVNTHLTPSAVDSSPMNLKILKPTVRLVSSN